MSAPGGSRTGVVEKLFRHRHGHHFGFIVPDSGPDAGRGIHFLLKRVQGGPVTVGDRVEFDEVETERGPTAVYVRLVKAP